MKQNFDYKSFSAAILDKRSKENITLNDAAKEMKIAVATLQRMEAGKGKPEINNILAVCTWLDRSILLFIKKTSPKNAKNKTQTNKN